MSVSLRSLLEAFLYAWSSAHGADLGSLRGWEFKDRGGEIEVEIAFFDSQPDVGFFFWESEEDGVGEAHVDTVAFVIFEVLGFVDVCRFVLGVAEFDTEDVPVGPSVEDFLCASSFEWQGEAVSAFLFIPFKGWRVCGRPGVSVGFYIDIIDGVSSANDAVQIGRGQSDRKDLCDVVGGGISREVDIL